MKTFDTLTEALVDLRSRGFKIDFNLTFNSLTEDHLGLNLSPDEFEIMEVYRFEGDSNPDDESIVYAIQSHHGLKGVIVNAFGPYADAISEEMIRKLAIHHPS
ncbi:MAG: hypothetical protein ACYCOO_11495 [Chitinophagaceae bacterium]